MSDASAPYAGRRFRAFARGISFHFIVFLAFLELLSASLFRQITPSHRHTRPIFIDSGRYVCSSRFAHVTLDDIERLIIRLALGILQMVTIYHRRRCRRISRLERRDNICCFGAIARFRSVHSQADRRGILTSLSL